MSHASAALRVLSQHLTTATAFFYIDTSHFHVIQLKLTSSSVERFDPVAQFMQISVQSERQCRGGC